MTHKGKCRFPHGHNYLFDVTVRGPLSEEGMVIDFSALKAKAKEYFAACDHAFVLHHKDPFAVVLRSMQANARRAMGEGVETKVVLIDAHPTAENIALLVKHELGALLGVPIKVVVHETRDCSAEVTSMSPHDKHVNTVEVW